MDIFVINKYLNENIILCRVNNDLCSADIVLAITSNLKNRVRLKTDVKVLRH